MPTCTLGHGAELNYEVHGPEFGPAVLLFNGAFSNLGMWSETIPVPTPLNCSALVLPAISGSSSRPIKRIVGGSRCLSRQACAASRTTAAE